MHRFKLHLEFAKLLLRSGKSEKALIHYHKALELSSSSCSSSSPEEISKIHFRLGNLYAKHDDLKSEFHYTCAISLKPDMAEAWHNVGTLYLRNGSNDCALTCFVEALHLRKKYPDANFNVATALRRLGRQAEAVRFSWKTILDLTSSSHEDISKHLNPINCSSNPSCSDNNTKQHLTVVCVKWGKKYDSEYVLKLFRGVKRHLNQEHDFVCFTDDDKGLRDVKGIMIRKFTETGWTGWWNKATLFSSSSKLSGRVMFIDLDTVIVSSLDKLSTFRGLFSTLGTDDFKNEGRVGGLNSSVMLWNASSPLMSSIFERLRLITPSVMNQCVHRFDHWLEMNLIHVPRLQTLFPKLFVEYAQHCTRDSFPSDCAVINFPLEPKPHKVVESSRWMKKHWC